jgi:hypothetical protein
MSRLLAGGHNQVPALHPFSGPPRCTIYSSCATTVPPKDGFCPGLAKAQGTRATCNREGQQKGHGPPEPRAHHPGDVTAGSVMPRAFRLWPLGLGSRLCSRSAGTLSIRDARGALVITSYYNLGEANALRLVGADHRRWHPHPHCRPEHPAGLGPHAQDHRLTTGKQSSRHEEEPYKLGDQLVSMTPGTMYSRSSGGRSSRDGGSSRDRGASRAT